MARKNKARLYVVSGFVVLMHLGQSHQTQPAPFMIARAISKSHRVPIGISRILDLHFFRFV